MRVEHNEAALADKFGLVHDCLEDLATPLEGWLFLLTFDAFGRGDRALFAEQRFAFLLVVLRVRECLVKNWVDGGRLARYAGKHFEHRLRLGLMEPEL